MKNRKSLENPENCTPIKHFIKESIRKISPGFSGNPRKSEEILIFLRNPMEIYENQRK